MLACSGFCFSGVKLMSVRRVLVGCAVLSLQDACVFYPCCKGCFSRIDAEERDALRYRCSRCGYWCLKDHVDYRYRLSLRVVRDTSIFGVTVFGNSLNSFFGIHASRLQRLVADLEGPLEPSARSTLLVKAVEDCFLGRHFIFGIKVSRTQREPWLEDPDGNESSGRERAQFVASQMILPTASGLTGCTVLSYYQRLLQKASEHVAESADPSIRPLAASLLLISGPSPNSTFSDVTLYPSGLLSQSVLGLQHQDHSFAPTSLWQQSLGLVTSSAEQEETCSQDGGGQSSSVAKHSTTPHPVQRVYPENHPGTEQKTVPLQLEGYSFHSSPSSTEYLNSSFGNSFRVKTCFSPSQPRCKSLSLTPKELSTPQQTKTFLSSSVAWDDLPFSESLTAFLCDPKKDLDALDKTTTGLNLQHQKQPARTFLEIAHLPAEQAAACQSTAEIISTDKLQDITNTVAPHGEGDNILPDQDCKNCAEHVNRSEDGEMQLDDEAFLFPGKPEEHNEADGYNCSADLFGDSLVIGVHTETCTTRFQCAEIDDQHLKNENSSVSHSTPHKQKLKINLGIKRDSLALQDLDFVPPSQSTPIIKVGLMTQSPAITSWRNWKDKSSKEDLMQSMRSSRCKKKITPGRRFRKPKKNKDGHPVGQHALQRGILSFESPRTTSQKPDSRASGVTICDCEDREGIVAPTPAHKMQQGVVFRKRWRTENSRRVSGCNRKGSGGDGGEKTQTVFNANETVGERYFHGSEDQLSEDGNHTCNWSKDLFSDSI